MGGRTREVGTGTGAGAGTGTDNRNRDRDRVPGTGTGTGIQAQDSGENHMRWGSHVQHIAREGRTREGEGVVGESRLSV